MRGVLKIKFEGLNSSKIINNIIDSGIMLKNIKEKRKYILFEIKESDEKEFRQICKMYHKRFEILSRNNFVGALKKSRYYFGFVLSNVLIFLFLFSFNLFVYEVNIKVSSKFDFDTRNIENILRENGVVVGMKKSDLERERLEKLILSSQENVSGCTIKQNGGVLNIEIYPAVLKEEVSKENIYSKYNAVVTKVNIFSGKSDLKVGDFVKTNDLLIENDNGASGEILGKIYFTDYLIYNENQTVKEFTGEFIEKTSVSIFNKNLNKRGKNISFSNFVEENCVFYVSKYNFVPVKFIKTKYKEFVYKDKVIKFLEKENELKKTIYNEVYNKVDEKFKEKITNVTYSIVTENNLTRLDCFIECEIDLVAN